MSNDEFSVSLRTTSSEEDKEFNKIEEISVFNASPVTGELEQVIYDYIYQNYGQKYRVNIVKNLEYDKIKTTYIIICPAGLKEFKKPINYIVYQLEQYIYKTFLHNEKYLDFIKSAKCIWEYNKLNINYLQNKGCSNIIYFPIGYSKSLTMENLQEYNDNDRDIDILFLGWTLPNSRRSKIEEILKSKNYKVLFTVNLSYENMKKMICRSKICLNIHFQEDGFLETVRLSNYLSNRSCVISEYSNDHETDEIYKNGVVFVDYNEMINIIHHYLINPHERKDMADKSFEWYTKDRNLNILIDKNIKV